MDTKFFATSLRFWGIAITILSAVAPVVGKAFGVDLNAADLSALGQAGSEVINGVGALVGTGMTLWGAWKADKPLSVKPPSK